MIVCTAGLAKVAGAMTMNNAAALEREGAELIGGDIRTFDFAEVTEADSAGIAILFSWMRIAKAAGVNLQFANIPVELQSLAAVYDVNDLLTTVQGSAAVALS